MVLAPQLVFVASTTASAFVAGQWEPTGAYKYRRPVWLVSLSTGSVLAFGQVSGVIQVGSS